MDGSFVLNTNGLNDNACNFLCNIHRKVNGKIKCKEKEVSFLLKYNSLLKYNGRYSVQSKIEANLFIFLMKGTYTRNRMQEGHDGLMPLTLSRLKVKRINNIYSIKAQSEKDK